MRNSPPNTDYYAESQQPKDNTNHIKNAPDLYELLGALKTMDTNALSVDAFRSKILNAVYQRFNPKKPNKQLEPKTKITFILLVTPTLSTGSDLSAKELAAHNHLHLIDISSDLSTSGYTLGSSTLKTLVPSELIPHIQFTWQPSPQFHLIPQSDFNNLVTSLANIFNFWRSTLGLPAIPITELTS